VAAGGGGGGTGGGLESAGFSVVITQPAAIAASASSKHPISNLTFIATPLLSQPTLQATLHPTSLAWIADFGG
jgi:hypothetical protein